MDVPRNASSLILPVRVVDDDGNAITGIAHNDASLTIEALKHGDSAYASVALAAGTLGTYVSGGWVELGSGYYQFCPPNGLVVEGRSTAIRLTYATNKPQDGSINAVGSLSGSGSVIVMPVLGVTPKRVQGSNIETFEREVKTHTIPVREEDGLTPVDLSGKTLEAIIQTDDEEPINVETVPVTVSGAGSDIVSFTTTRETSDRTGECLLWAVRETNANAVLWLYGKVEVVRAAYAVS